MNTAPTNGPGIDRLTDICDAIGQLKSAPAMTEAQRALLNAAHDIVQTVHSIEYYRTQNDEAA